MTLLKIFNFNALHFNKATAVGVVQGLTKLLLSINAAFIWGLYAPAQAATVSTAPSVVLVVGDSLSAEYGLTRGTGWVALLEKQLALEKSTAKVVNASISGDTTSGGKSRLAALLTRHQPTVVVIELGGNDALRGLPLEMTQKNLNDMVRAALDGGAKVLLLGMQVPPNYGTAYSARFAQAFSNVSAERKVPLVPFFLKGIADVPNPTAQFQADLIHPNSQAQPKMLANVWPALKKLIP